LLEFQVVAAACAWHRSELSAQFFTSSKMATKARAEEVYPIRNEMVDLQIRP
jgi:hypothetical protein